jgi:N-acetylmuramoyl-L-alanine amidase
MIKNKLKRLKYIIFILAMMAFPILVQASSSAKIMTMRLFETEDSTRIIVNLSAPASTHIFELQNPDRLVLDFNNTELRMNLNMLRLMPPIFKSIRGGFHDSTTFRIVIDMDVPFTFKKIPQLDEKQIVVDVFTQRKMKKIQTVKSPIIKSTASISLPQPVTRKRPFIVVVDAGHGGKDTGAIGDRKTREKDVVLAIARQLADLINQQPDMRAVMTRKGDYFVTLGNRLVLARKGEADLFIAIHADSYFNNRASGASVFALSSHGATTVAARWLSDSDNHSELGGVELNQLNDKSYLLRSVLIDLAQTATIRDSLRFGNSVLDGLESITRLHSPRVEQAPFMVLKSPDIPSILVETGFISNETEEMRLRDKAYQHKIALALYNGIRLYQKKYAPVGM